MLLDPRAPLFVGTILVFLVGGLLATYSPMPGGLASPHARVESLSALESCNSCHGPDGTTAGCLACHEEIAGQLEENRGYHHYLLEGKDVECSRCHAEHMGREFALVNETSWGAQVASAFRHPHVEFSLAGKHGRLPCAACHSGKLAAPFTLRDFASVPRERTFFGLDQECTSCHDDLHSGGLSTDCESCHGQEAFIPTVHFDHDRHFPLDGGHAHVPCGECHIIPPPDSPSAPLPFPFHRVRGTTCLDCHESPHRLVGAPCQSCHLGPAPLWTSAISAITPERHAAIGFRLTEPHAEVSCRACHPRHLAVDERYHDPSAPGYLRHEDSCQGCHEDVHRGQFEDRHGRCLDCHDRLRFSPTAFRREAHTEALPLTGAHGAVACTSCHRVDPHTQVRQFVGTPARCQVCHENPHGDQFRDELASRGCRMCHRNDSDSFRIRPFNHQARTGFRLEGAHSTAACEGCHIERPAVLGGKRTRVRRFEGTPTGCVDCHRNVHRGQFKDYGERNCTACHVSTSDWKELDFDHNTQSRFALRGAHARIACSSCHRPVIVNDGSEVVQFKPLGTDCRDCHDTVPRSQ